MTYLAHRRKHFVSQGASILFIADSAGTPSTGDQVIIDALEADGMTVTVIDHNTATGTETGYDAAVISGDVNSSDITTTYKDSTFGVLFLHHVLFIANKISLDWWTDTSRSSMDSANDSHEIMVDAGLSGTDISILSSSVAMKYMRNTEVGGGVQGVCYTRSSTIRYLVACYESGATMYDSFTAPARRAAWGLIDSGAEVLNANGEALMVSIVKWTAGKI